MNKILWVVFFAMLTPSARAQENVNLILLLAVDVSNSIGHDEYEVQHRGTVEALRDPAVAEAVRLCTPGGLAIGYAEWGSRRLVFNLHRYLIEPFARIDSADDLRAFAERVGSRGRTADFSQTDLAGAIADGVRSIEDARFTADRRTIDISSDGLQGIGGPNGEPALDYLRHARDEALADDVSINALVLDRVGPTLRIGEEFEGNLEAYYKQFLIGGTNAFTIKIDSVREVRDAMVRKLKREICEATS